MIKCKWIKISDVVKKKNGKYNMKYLRKVVKGLFNNNLSMCIGIS